MNYDEIDNDWVQHHRPKGTSGPLPAPIRQERNGRYYLGMRLPSKPRRLLTGLLIYAPAWVCWFSVMAEQDDWLDPTESTFWRIHGTLLVVGLTVAGYWWCFFAAPQHEGQNPWARRVMQTRVVSVRRDASGELRVYYPTNWQLMIRAAMVSSLMPTWAG
ncbi:MAG: hypothetical protein M3Q47_15165 [Actinomycetota bacterium]|nr:hypothetical protein [Actinomycetota bacterium]